VTWPKKGKTIHVLLLRIKEQKNPTQKGEGPAGGRRREVLTYLIADPRREEKSPLHL